MSKSLVHKAGPAKIKKIKISLHTTTKKRVSLNCLERTESKSLPLCLLAYRGEINLLLGSFLCYIIGSVREYFAIQFTCQLMVKIIKLSGNKAGGVPTELGLPVATGAQTR